MPIEDANILYSILSSMNGFTMEAGATFDNKQAIDQINEMVRAGKIGATELGNLLANTGFTYKLDYETVEVKNEQNWWQKLWGIDAGTSEIKVPKFTPIALGSAPTKIDSGYVGGGSSGGGSSSKPEPYENSYDKLYNTMEDLNELSNERNDLEREYSLLLLKSSTNAADLVENLQKQVANLEAQAKLQREIASFREQQIRDTMAENSDLTKYARYNFEDNTIEIDWDAINAVTDEDLGGRIED
jgi:hypothetical protein